MPRRLLPGRRHRPGRLIVIGRWRTATRGSTVAATVVRDAVGDRSWIRPGDGPALPAHRRPRHGATGSATARHRGDGHAGCCGRDDRTRDHPAIRRTPAQPTARPDEPPAAPAVRRWCSGRRQRTVVHDLLPRDVRDRPVQRPWTHRAGTPGIDGGESGRLLGHFAGASTTVGILQATPTADLRRRCGTRASSVVSRFIDRRRCLRAGRAELQASPPQTEAALQAAVGRSSRRRRRRCPNSMARSMPAVLNAGQAAPRVPGRAELTAISWTGSTSCGRIGPPGGWLASPPGLTRSAVGPAQRRYPDGPATDKWGRR